MSVARVALETLAHEIRADLAHADRRAADLATWRVELLEQASSPLPGRRGIILPKDGAVDELRRFRHKLRHRYDLVVEVDQLHPVIKNAVASWPRIRTHLAVFAEFVDKCRDVAE